jgi:CxxC-x17-CxxC domain-containing protein
MVPERELREARDRFAALLEKPESLEREWQELFTRFPFVLTKCLSLGIEPQQLIPCKPGQSEADFYFYPEQGGQSPSYGVIELKRPNTPVYRVPRKGILCLAADTYCAVRQAQEYAERLGAQIARPPPTLIVGNPRHMFVLAGLQSEIFRRVSRDLLQSQAEKLFPPGCKIVHFDELNDRVRSLVPPHMYLVVPPYRGQPLDLVFGLRRMNRAVCSDCGIELDVPFRPTEGKPVYCSNCSRKARGV